MANFEALNDDVLEEAAGGKSNINYVNWEEAHWQPRDHAMGTTWTDHGRNWYRIKPGDTLSGIAQRYGYTVAQLQSWNSKTIKNVNTIFAGDAIALCEKGNGHL